MGRRGQEEAARSVQQPRWLVLSLAVKRLLRSVLTYLLRHCVLLRVSPGYVSPGCLAPLHSEGTPRKSTGRT